MSEPQSEAGRMTRAEIRAQSAKYRTLEQDLLTQVIAMEKTGVADRPADGQDGKVRARARERLNGQGARLMPVVTGGGASLAEIRIDLEAVRLIQATLTNAGVELDAVAALERADALTPAWRALCREWLLAAERFTAIEKAAQAFLEGAGHARQALERALIGQGSEIRWNGWDILAEVIAEAEADGLVSGGDLRKARQVRAGQ